jgi:hypothetical protein
LQTVARKRTKVENKQPPEQPPEFTWFCALFNPENKLNDSGVPEDRCFHYWNWPYRTLSDDPFRVVGASVGPQVSHGDQNPATDPPERQTPRCDQIV